MDDIDRAQEQEEWYRSQALDNRQVIADAMPFAGNCYNCEAPVEWGRFCDPDCRDDYQKRIKLQRI